MDKVNVSCTMNRWTGGEDELLCHRIYLQSRLRGGFWTWLKVTIDVTFFVIRRERKHTFRNFIWQRREHGKKKAKAVLQEEGRAKMNRIEKRLALELQEWEFDHSSPPKLHPIQWRACNFCGQVTCEAVGLFVSKHVRNEKVDFYFCGETCANEYYLDRLRKEGL